MSNMPLGQSKQVFEKLTVNGVSMGQEVRLNWVERLNSYSLYCSWVVEP